MSAGVAGAILLDDAQPDDLVFVTEDVAALHPGCDAISIFSSRTGEPIIRGQTQVSPGRIALSPDVSLAVSPASNSWPFLYVMRRLPTEPATWSFRALAEFTDIAVLSAATILPDNDTVLLTVGSGEPSTGVPTPFRIGWYKISEMDGRHHGPPHGERGLDGAPIRIFMTDDDTVHVVTDQPRVYTLSTSQLVNKDAPIDLQPYRVRPYRRIDRLTAAHATITGDGAYIVTNRYERPDLNVADLAARRAYTVTVPNVSVTGGVAINRGPVNASLLALHAGSEVVVYSFAPPQTLVELSRIAIPAPESPDLRDCASAEGELGCGGPLLSIAWSGSGSQLIAAANDGTAEFVVISVADGGQSLRIENTLAACTLAEEPNVPNDVVTTNGMVIPSPTPTPTEPTATVTATPTVTASRTATATEMPTDEPTATSIPTNVPSATDTVTLTPTSEPTAAPSDTPTSAPSPTPSRTSSPAATATSTPTTRVELPFSTLYLPWAVRKR